MERKREQKDPNSAADGTQQATHKAKALHFEIPFPTQTCLGYICHAQEKVNEGC